ncbi:MAG: cation:proton antiporter, partial [Candidatus Woesebacteria bacterium]|nr:cation:proton antiporter [Candidatus Woesebacteria bacterium]
LNVAVVGALIQIVLVTLLGYLILSWFGLAPLAALVLSLGFSISSTAVLVKILGDSGETDTIHGEIMLGWSLVQDLTVIPIMVILPLLASARGEGIGLAILIGLGKALLVILGVILLGKKVVPFFVHILAGTNSRELLLLASIALALGTAAITSFFGISPALGAFLAGVVIAESQEHHAIFAETRPLRDLFVALFFVTLGFLVAPSVIISKFGLIIILTLVVIVLKVLVIFLVSSLFGYKGKTGIATSFGLAQVGEFAFVIFSAALVLKILSPEETSVGIAVTLLTLILSPILYKYVVPFWRKVKKYKIFMSGEKHDFDESLFKDHIIICGYGRVGSWVGKALKEYEIPFVVIDYNQKVVQELKEAGTLVAYGDPTEPEVLEAVGIRNAKAIILAIPDRVAQETLIAYTQSVAPHVKIISRAHRDEDWEKLKTLRVDKVIQPEFEAAVEIIRSVLISRGKNRNEISDAIRNLRVSHSR